MSLRRLLSAVLVIAGPAAALGQTGTWTGDSAAVAARVDSLLRARTAADSFAGVVLVAAGGRILLRAGYGSANRELDRPNTPEGRFRIASLTKSFTAMAILQLEAEGRLLTSDPVSRFVPDWPRGGEMTIHQVVTHTAGLADILDLPAYWGRVNGEATTLEEALELLRPRPLLSPPGTAWSYSNAGYLLLGLIIERASGMTYETFLRTRILDRLGMQATGLETTTPIEEFGISGYGRDERGRFTVPEINMTVNSAAGSLYSTVDDLYRWDRALYGNTLLPEPFMKRLFTPERNYYGYGWGITTMPTVDRRVIFMNGRFAGFTASIHRFPDDDVCLIVLANLEDLDPIRLSREIAGIVFAGKS